MNVLFVTLDQLRADCLSTAGHPRPIVVPKSGAAPYEMETDGSLLGIFEGEQFIDITATLGPGDRLVLYTDGVEVAFPNTDGGDEMTYDQDRWKAELLSCRHQKAEEMLMHLSASIDAQQGSLRPGDDLTVILMEMLEFNDADSE